MSRSADFVIENGILKKYIGSGGDVAIPQGVTAIGPRAFSFCTALTDVTIPGSVRRIGDEAFFCCEALRSAAVEAGVEEIGDGAFWNCKELLSASLPQSVVRIGAKAFCDCWKLSQIALPDRVTRIERMTFINCWEMKAATLPESLEAIDDEAFRFCYNLGSARIPAGVTRIGREAFAHCSALSSVDLPARLAQIDAEAFCGCERLREVALPESATKVGRGAFSACTGLTTAAITDAVVDFSTFSGCRSLDAFVVSPASRRYRVLDGVVFSRDGKRLIAYPPGRSRERYDIPQTASAVGDNAFAGAPVRLVFVHGGVESFSQTAASGSAEGDPYVATGNAAFISRLGKPIYLGSPEDLSNRNRRRAAEGFLFALEAGVPEMEPWTEDYVGYLRREYGIWEKRAWRDEALLELAMDRRMLRVDTARSMQRKYSAAGREEMASRLSDYIASAEE